VRLRNRLSSSLIGLLTAALSVLPVSSTSHGASNAISGDICSSAPSGAAAGAHQIPSTPALPGQHCLHACCSSSSGSNIALIPQRLFLFAVETTFEVIDLEVPGSWRAIVSLAARPRGPPSIG
jgi:hypothetical protein